ncbi:MAG: efflux RND transporter periplasmic adaptor subunit [Planctomycetota bacterium]
MKNSGWKIGLYILLAAAAVIGLGWGLLPQDVQVDTAIVRRGAIEITVDDDGETRVRERYTVLSPLTGKLQRISLHAGDTVSRTETELAVIEPTDPSLLDTRTKTEAEARVRLAGSAQERAMEAKKIADDSFALAEQEYGRGKSLIESNAISASELDQLFHRFRVASGEVRLGSFLIAIADHELAMAKAALITTQTGSYESMRLTSPIDGVVLRVLREDAGFVNPGTPLLEIGNPTDMELKIDVLSTAATRIRPGNKVSIEHWGGGRTLAGTVRLVEPSAFLKISALGVEEKRVNVIIDFDTTWEERKTLGDGFRVEARIAVDRSAENSLIVPSGALFREGDAWMLYRLRQGRAERCPVTVGLSNPRESEIVSGVAEGDEVILYPSEKVGNGVRVSRNSSTSRQ